MSLVNSSTVRTWRHSARLAHDNDNDVAALVRAREALRCAQGGDRLPKLIELWANGQVTNCIWLRLLGEEWSSFDNIHAHHNTLMNRTPFWELVRDPAWRRPLLMSESERGVLEALPSKLEIFRGCYEPNAKALRWSIDRDAAIRLLSRRQGGEGEKQPLICASVKKSDVLFLKLDRGECEIVTNKASKKAASARTS